MRYIFFPGRGRTHFRQIMINVKLKTSESFKLSPSKMSFSPVLNVVSFFPQKQKWTLMENRWWHAVACQQTCQTTWRSLMFLSKDVSTLRMTLLWVFFTICLHPGWISDRFKRMYYYVYSRYKVYQRISSSFKKLTSPLV